MQVVLRKWTPQYKYKNFLTHFRLSLFPGCFGENLTNISQIFIPYKSALSGCIPPKIKCEILAHNGSQTTRAPGDYHASWNRKPTRTTGPLGVNDDWSRFPGKSNPLQTCFFLFCFVFLISIAQRSVEEDGTIMSKVTKGKEKTCSKNGKTGKCAEEQNNESTYSFQNYDSRRLLMFLYQSWYLL